MSIDQQAPRSRRAVLGAALGGLGALVASRLASPAKVSANPGDAVLVDGTHTGAATTSITSTTIGPAITGSSAGVGVYGASIAGTGLLGTAGDNSAQTVGTEIGVRGFSGLSSDSAGVWGQSVDGAGTVGTSGENGTGVVANAGGYGLFADAYFGVYAYGRVAVTGDAFSDSTGVYGFSGTIDAPLPPAGVGVQATAGSTSQIALNVTGRAKFSRSARTFISAGSYSRKVTMAGVTTSSYIIATLQTRRTGVYVHAVVPASGYFVIYLNKAVTATTYVGYLVIN